MLESKATMAPSIWRVRLAWQSKFSLAIVVLNLAWETLQLPLYAIWKKGSPGEIVFAVLHCTLGDLLIALVALNVALLAIGKGWPAHNLVRSLGGAVGLGMAYTAFSEWRNALVLKTWAYSELMPTVPGLHIGLSPMLQWLLIPGAAALWAQWATKKAGRALGRGAHLRLDPHLAQTQGIADDADRA